MAGPSSHVPLESTPLLNPPPTMSTMESTQSDDKNSLKDKVMTIPTADTSIREGSIDDVTALDNAILKAQGHDAAMSRPSSMPSALGLGFSITNSWVGYLL
jgi:choline transport protein